MQIRKFIDLLCCIPMVSVANLPQDNPVPGGIVNLPLDIKSSESPVVEFHGKRVLVRRNDNDEWIAVVGLPLSLKEKEASIKIISPQKKEISFSLKKPHYKVEKLTLKNNRHVNPNKEDLKKIQEDQIKVKEALSRFTDKQPNLELQKPTAGRLSSSFGLRRIMNGIEKNPHSGMDIAAPTGTIVNASGSGEVVLVSSLFYSGNTIIIDHGHGLFTVYCHLDTIDVKEGTLVNRGDVIGTVGKTGRVTGAHLHWGVELNGTKVDPSLFLKQDKG